MMMMMMRMMMMIVRMIIDEDDDDDSPILVTRCKSFSLEKWMHIYNILFIHIQCSCLK